MKPDCRSGCHLWMILLALAAVLCAVSSQSLWIDECATAHFSVQPTLGGWWHMMLTDHSGSDAQMPFYLFWTWLWEKVFGHGEWALRLAGWPWLAAGIAIFGWRKPAYAAVCGLSAFLWFYADEARPYAMQAGLALALMRATLALAGEKPEPRAALFWQWILIVSGTLLAMSHLLGVFWTAAYWGFCALCVPGLRRGEMLKKTAPPWLVAFVLLTATGAYYGWTLHIGLRATDAGTTDLRNVVYALYELTGLAGLGPGRGEIRQDGLAAFQPFAPQLAVAALLVFLLLGAGIVMLLRRLGLKRGTLFLAFMGATTLFILGVGVEKHFRVLARHLTPLLPVLLWLLAAGAEGFWRRRTSGQCLVILAAALALASCLEIRFAARHAKDDYRSAAAVAVQALDQHQMVWWNADTLGAWYYHVPIGRLDEVMPDKAIWMVNPPAGLVETLPRPDCLITSKPDLYDPQGYVHDYEMTNGYQVTKTFMSFKVWRK